MTHLNLLAEGAVYPCSRMFMMRSQKLYWACSLDIPSGAHGLYEGGGRLVAGGGIFDNVCKIAS